MNTLETEIAIAPTDKAYDDYLAKAFADIPYEEYLEREFAKVPELEAQLAQKPLPAVTLTSAPHIQPGQTWEQRDEQYLQDLFAKGEEQLEQLDPNVRQSISTLRSEKTPSATKLADSIERIAHSSLDNRWERIDPQAQQSILALRAEKSESAAKLADSIERIAYSSLEKSKPEPPPVPAYEPVQPTRILSSKAERARRAVSKRSLVSALNHAENSFIGTLSRIAASVALMATASLAPYKAPQPTPIPTSVTITTMSPQQTVHTLLNEGIFNTYPVPNREIRLTSLMGRRNLPGHWIHQGNDYHALAGDYVIAPRAGVVTRVSSQSVTVEAHGIGYKLFHVRPRKIALGARVEEGDTLARILGRRWLPTGMYPHLHMETWVDESIKAGVYKPLRGQRLQPAYLFNLDIREKIIDNLEAQPKWERPSGLRYLKGNNVRDKMYDGFNRLTNSIRYHSQERRAGSTR